MATKKNEKEKEAVKDEQMVSLGFNQYKRLKAMAKKEKRSMRAQLDLLMDEHEGK